MTDSQNQMYKLFSIKSITLATFLGGPLISGILIRKNYINLGNKKYANYAFWLGVFSFIFLIILLNLIPENIFDMIPRYVFPAIYSPIILYFIEKFQGKALKEHAENNGEFYSNWIVAGISLIFIVIVLGIILLGEMNSENIEKLNDGYKQISQNEEKAMMLYYHLNSSNHENCLYFIDNTGIPAWEENIRILNELDEMVSFDYDTYTQIQLLKKYTNLRILVFRYIKEAILNNETNPNYKINYTHQKIEEVVQELNTLNKLKK